ncbi:ANK_REP_REGION domain-containing protein [Caerostris darwini]|uniref:ANK_REP_REGION domain-containing protein n=1 Tax=Caerostris darwini TaxID=1538125 RepID=A0AAV4WSW8_9ARAC|nr:ANK_REP_REGION domain-containing protein [Caerostris darwini]
MQSERSFPNTVKIKATFFQNSFQGLSSSMEINHFFFSSHEMYCKKKGISLRIRTAALVSPSDFFSVYQKRKYFIENNEATFKFHPWQMVSTLDILRKILHNGLHERSIHHLWDTGAAKEILNFSKKNSGPVKVQQLIHYLSAYLGLHFQHCNSKSRVISNYRPTLSQNRRKTPQHIKDTSNNLLKKSGEAKIFEIKKLIETVAQELVFLSSITDENNHSILYSLKLSRYHMGSVKKQKLACCSYPSCLFNIRQKLWKNNLQINQKTYKKTPRAKEMKMKHNIIKQNRNKYIPRITLQQRVNAISQRNQTLVQKLQPKYPKRKRLVEMATQTIPWTPESPHYSSSFQNSLRNVSDNGEDVITESEEELYCKSDTLNDASMITEEIASDFLAVQSRISHNESDISRSIKNSIIVEEEASSKNYENQSNHLEKSLKSDILTQNSVKDSSVVTSSKIKKSPSNRRETLTDRALASNSIRTKSKTIDHLSRILLEYKGKNIKRNSKSGSVTEEKSKVSKGSNKSRSKNTSRSLTPEKSIKQENITNGNSNKSKNSSKENSISPPRNSFAMEEMPDSKEDTMRKESLINTKEVLEPQDKINDTYQSESDNLSQPEENHNEVQEVDDGPLVLSSSDNETTYLPVVSNSSSANEDLLEDNSEGSSSFKENDNVSVEYSSHWTEECDSTKFQRQKWMKASRKNSLRIKRRY